MLHHLDLDLVETCFFPYQFQNSCVELDFLVEELSKSPKVYVVHSNSLPLPPFSIFLMSFPIGPCLYVAQCSAGAGMARA